MRLQSELRPDDFERPQRLFLDGDENVDDGDFEAVLALYGIKAPPDLAESGQWPLFEDDEMKRTPMIANRPKSNQLIDRPSMRRLRES